MRSSAVAPAPLSKEEERPAGGKGGGGGRLVKEESPKKAFPRQETRVVPPPAGEAVEELLLTETIIMNIRSPSLPTQEPPPLEASSASVEDNEEEAGNHFDDEEDGYISPDDDPFIYSDDSASLNDHYFLQPPHDTTTGGNGGLFGIMSDSESEMDPLEAPAMYTLDQVPTSASFIKGRRNMRMFGRRSDHRKRDSNTSVSSPIDEEEAVTESTSLLSYDRDFPNNHTGVITSSKQGTTSASSFRNRQERKRRKLQKQQRKLRLKVHHNQQQKQEERERAVTQIRGQPQPETPTDRVWLFVFLIQLLYVSFTAMKYGLSLTGPSVTTLAAPDSAAASITGTLPFAKALGSVPSVNTSNTALLPEDHGTDTTITSSSSSSFGTPSSVKDSTIDHLQDDDNIQPTIPDDQHTSLRTKSKKQTTVTTSVGATTTTTTHVDGSSTVVVDNPPFTVDYKNVLSLLLISGLYSVVISYLSFAFMLMVARSLIPIMLVFTILLLLCWGMFGLTVTTVGGSGIAILGFSLFGLSLAYTMVSWNRIPFCSTNLYTAICALRSSVMILLAGVMALFVALLWLFLWSIALMGNLNAGNGRDCAMWDECETHIVIRNGRLIELVVLGISLYWTTMVIKNIVRVTVADAIGCWWMQTDGTLFEPLVRACTTSLGTICFGSLVAFPASVLSVIGGFVCWAGGGVAKSSIKWASTPTKRMSASTEYQSTDNIDAGDFAREQKAVVNAVAMKIAQEKNCLRQFGRQLQACNRWAYTYVGMYNYSFLEGGKKAIDLFETREWMEIVRDNLIQNILVMASVVIGGSSAMVAVLVEEVDGYNFTSLHQPIVTSFWIGFVLGFVLSNVLLLGVVGSAVNTILVSRYFVDGATNDGVLLQACFLTFKFPLVGLFRSGTFPI